MEKQQKTNLLVTVEKLHQCAAAFSCDHEITEWHEGELVWSGVVFQFDLIDHPSARTCYAWASPVDGSNRERVYAILHEPPIDSPQAAVRAAIVADYKAGRAT